jgi:hypothetical protein
VSSRNAPVTRRQYAPGTIAAWMDHSGWGSALRAARERLEIAATISPTPRPTLSQKTLGRRFDRGRSSTASRHGIVR